MAEIEKYHHDRWATLSCRAGDGGNIRAANAGVQTRERPYLDSGRAGCALSSPGRTPNRAAVAKKGDTGQPTAPPSAIESRPTP